MRYLLLIITLVYLLFASCKKKENIDTSMLDNYISTIDSLNNALTEISNKTINGIYKISDNTVIADSISKIVLLPDNVMFYEYLKKKILEINDVLYDSQQEIYFAKDQLEGLRDDVSQNQTSAIQYEMQLESEKEMLELLKRRVSSSIQIIKDISDSLHISDTVSL